MLVLTFAQISNTRPSRQWLGNGQQLGDVDVMVVSCLKAKNPTHFLLSHRAEKRRGIDSIAVVNTGFLAYCWKNPG